MSSQTGTQGHKVSIWIQFCALPMKSKLKLFSMFCFEEISPLNVNWSHKHKQENAKILLMNLWFMFWYTNFFPVTLRWEKTFKRFRYLSFKTSLFVLIHYLNILRFKHWPTLWKETQSRVRRRSFQLQRGHGFSDLILFQKYIKPKDN